MRNKLLLFLKFILGWPLSLVALFFIGRTFFPHLSTISSKITHINVPLLVLGILSFISYYLLRSFIWYKLLRFLGYELDPHESLFLWSYSQLRRYIPGNIWGFLSITLLYNKRKVQKKDIAHALFVEFQLVILATLCVSLLAIPFLLHYLLNGNWLLWKTAPFIMWGMVALSIVYIASPYVLSRISHKWLANLKQLFPKFNYEKTLLLFALMLLAFILFGLGYYLTFTSLVYLDPRLLWQFIGFFVFSLLLGYLSIITPTGLGVREGAIAVGLSKIVPLDIAGFIALFSRVILVVAELLFVLIAFLVHRLKQGAGKKLIALLGEHQSLVVVCIGVIIFSLYFTAISFLRYDNFYTGRFDLGNMTQTVWNTMHGRIFEFTNPNGTNTISRLAFHADFILIAFAPLYFLWDSPKVLLLMQVLISASGAFFVYALARDVIKNKPVAVVLALLYLLNPSMERATMYDFHAVTLATTFLLGAFYFLYKRRYAWFLILAILAGLTKEQIWAIIALLGLYIAFIQKQRKLGLTIFALSILAVYLLIWRIIPNALGSQHFALSYYDNGDLSNSSPTSLLKRFLFSPQTEIPLLFEKGRITYIKQLLGPLGFLPLFGPFYLIFALPDFIINFSSNNANLYQIYYQYTAAITPFLFIAVIFGIAFILRKVPKLPISTLIVYLIFCGIFGAYLYGPLPGSKEPNLEMLTRQLPYRQKLDDFLQTIPENASVSAGNSIGSHLSHRRQIFSLPNGIGQADYIVFRLGEAVTQPSKPFSQLKLTLEKDPRYQQIFSDDGVVAFKKRT